MSINIVALLILENKQLSPLLASSPHTTKQGFSSNICLFRALESQ